MQKTIQRFAQVDIPGAGIVSLAIKVVVTVGPARRFLIGDPTIQLVDALAGETFIDWLPGNTIPKEMKFSWINQPWLPWEKNQSVGMAGRRGEW